jgi:hypothetical protein
MNKEKSYKCVDCGKVISTAGDIPECCGKPMKIDLEVCRTAPHAEMARTENTDEPCDDGRKG